MPEVHSPIPDGQPFNAPQRIRRMGLFEVLYERDYHDWEERAAFLYPAEAYAYAIAGGPGNRLWVRRPDRQGISSVALCRLSREEFLAWANERASAASAA